MQGRNCTGLMSLLPKLNVHIMTIKSSLTDFEILKMAL